MTGGSGVRARPQRTCTGCRARAAKVELLRVVVVDGAFVPDPASRLPGRGAYVHPDAVCLELALRRKGLSRTLRVTGAVDETAVRAWLSDPTGSSPSPSSPGAGQQPMTAR